MADDAHKGEVASVYVFSFSGFMLAGGLDQNTARSIKRAGLTFDIQPPRRIAPPTWRPIPQFDLTSIARLFPGAPTNVPLLRVAVLPSLDASGKPALQAIFSDDEPIEGLPPDTLVIVARGPGHESNGEKICVEIVSEICLWLRLLTRQWWIGKPTELLTGNLHTVIGLKAGDLINGWPTGRSSQTSPEDGTRLVDQAIWFEAIAKVENNEAPASTAVLMSDASYYFFTKEYRMAIIVACSIFEILRDELIFKYNISKQKMKVGDTDILGHFTKGFEEIFGRNLQMEKPSSYDFLKSCWIARGHVAHGGALVWFKNGKKAPLESLSSSQFSNEIADISNWILSIKKPAK